MSMLDTVELQGIRSVGVGPQNAAVVEFLSPLTILCGPNGAGKTTVIEALKYVTTGELPKGNLQAFIHDIRLCDKARVDASVKLKFRDIRGRCCVVTRRMMQFKGAKGKLSNKSEESTIAIENEHGEWKSLSSKVIDCKKEILNLLGLPAAILDYVVFCHQEESSWPLDEPKKLKERFDEIFQVTGYVKAIDVLKKELKENQQELKIIDNKLPFLVRQFEEKGKLHSEYSGLKDEVLKTEEEVTRSQNVLKELTVEKEKKVAELEQAETLQKKHDMIEAERQIFLDQIKCCSLPVYAGGIEELKREIDQLANSKEFVDVERDRTCTEARIERLKAEMKELLAVQERINRAIVECRTVQLLREKIFIERKQCVEKLCANFELHDEHDDLVQQLSRLINKYRQDVDNFNEERVKRMAVCQKEIDNLSESFALVSTKLDMKNGECRRLKEEIALMVNDLLEAQNSSQKLALLQREITEQEEALGRMRNIDEKTDELRKERDVVACKVEELRKECRAKENAEEAEKNIRRNTEIMKKFEEELNSLLGKHRNSIASIFGPEGHEFPISERLAIHARKVARDRTAAEELFKMHENELCRAQHALSQSSREVDRVTEQAATYKRRISKVVLSENDVERRLNEVRTLLKKSQQDLGVIDGCKFLYQEWEEEVVMKNCCPLCGRTGKSGDDWDCKSLAEKIKQRKEELPKEAERLLQKVKEYENLQNELMETVPYVGMLKELNSEQEVLQRTFNEARQKLDGAEEEFSTSKCKRDAVLEKEKLIRSLEIDASLMDNIWKSYSDAERQVNFLKTQVGDIDESLRQRWDDLSAELSRNEARFKDLVAELDKAQLAASERNRIVERLNELKERRAAFGQKVAQHDSTKKSLDGKKAELECCEKDLLELNEQKPLAEQQLQAKRKAREMMQNENKNEEAQLLRLLRNAEESAKELEKLDEKLANVVDESGKLGNLEKNLAENQTAVESIDAQVRELNTQMELFNSKQQRKRRLEDQLRKLELLERVKCLEERLKETEWHGSAISELKTELSGLLRKMNQLQLMIENKKGELNEKKKRLAVVKQNLESPQYVSSKEQLKKEVVKKCVTTKATKDLATYIRVMDESVVKFHTEKMEEVNEILGALWEHVYHGSDIETIRIKSESIDEMEKKRSYNYRVVMSVHGAEIDMPGRCSAGQKAGLFFLFF